MPNHRRRLLRVFAVVVVVCSLLLFAAVAVAAYRTYRFHEEQQLANELKSLGWESVCEPSVKTIEASYLYRVLVSVAGSDCLIRTTMIQIGNEHVPTNNDLNIVSHITGLRVVSIVSWQTAIDDDGLRHLSRLSRLEVLLLPNARITDRGIANLRPCSQLRELYVNGQSLTSQSIASFCQFPKLQELTLKDSMLTMTERHRLEGVLPNCRLTFVDTPLTEPAA